MSALPHAIIQSFSYLHISQYATVAAVALVIWDYFILLPEEVALVWPARWNLSKFLFMVNRYLVFVDTALLVYVLILGDDATVCEITFKASGAITLTGFLVSESILFLRAYAVWGSHFTKHFAVVLCLFLGMNVSCYWVLVKYLGGVSSTGPPAVGITGCTLNFRNRLVWINFVTGAMFESLCTFLLIVKTVQNSRFFRSPLMRVMFRDGIAYFVYMFIASIANVIVLLAAPAEINGFLIVVERVLYSVLCSRIILNIRGAFGTQIYAHRTAGDLPSVEISIRTTVESL
ncbi:hypothetical protein BD410DRAFT_632024 [Rickenella mellea]|uniref:DUF6533 domain-containing protein n=1 Tax=Rickenella mellea TaxID=50990 RepID=A0A4Y7QED8_9AGAM|nr:hypothetical protein BD410DRAFT_632024 [Rickenella mellea]